MSERPRVAVCIPSGTMVHADFAIALSALVAHSMGTTQIGVWNRKGTLVEEARNLLVEEAMAWRPDWLLWLDTDHRFPPEALLRLLGHDTDIAAATYRGRWPPFPVAGSFLDPTHDLAAGGLVEAEWLPAGLMLVRAAVYRAFPRPWYRNSYDAAGAITGEDVNFCRAARAAGASVWCDLDLSRDVLHLGELAVPFLRAPGA